MVAPHIFIRADASASLGMGHVMRCLTLAEALRLNGATVTFICRELEGNLCTFVEGKGFQVYRLPAPHGAQLDWQDDAARTLSFMETSPRPDWLVVDHYALDEKWEHSVRAHVERIMVIDDLANRPHDCDLLLDQNYLPDIKRYGALVPPTCRTLLGPKYALLREEFREARATLPERTGDVKRILVSLGGSDPSNLTHKGLNALSSSSFGGAVDVVVGAANLHQDELVKAVAAMPGTTLHVQANNMAELMARADLAVGAGGSTTWERCCLGLPSIVVTIAKNQEALTGALARDGYVFYLGDSAEVTVEGLSRALETLQNPFFLQGLSRRGLELVDGKGTQRVVRALQAFSGLEIRKALPADCKPVFEWRNDPRTRQHSLDPEPIPWEAHAQWFARVLDDPERKLLIGESKGEPVGVVRYDLLADAQAEVSVYLVPEKMGQGWGGALLSSAEAWLKAHEPHIKTLKATVRPENQASLKTFLKADFETDCVVFRKNL